MIYFQFPMSWICLLLLLTQGGGKFSERELVLERWVSETNQGYALEMRGPEGSDVLIPDVRTLAADKRFVTGAAYWRYLDGFYEASDTNKFWFVVDKQKLYPATTIVATTNLHDWISWCSSNNAPTNLQSVPEFIDGQPESEGAPRL